MTWNDALPCSVKLVRATVAVCEKVICNELRAAAAEKYLHSLIDQPDTFHAGSWPDQGIPF